MNTLNIYGKLFLKKDFKTYKAWFKPSTKKTSPSTKKPVLKCLSTILLKKVQLD